MMGLVHLSHKREFNEEMRGYEEGNARFEGRISFVKLDVMHLLRYIEAGECTIKQITAEGVYLFR